MCLLIQVWYGGKILSCKKSTRAKWELRVKYDDDEEETVAYPDAAGDVELDTGEIKGSPSKKKRRKR
jgi:hypothetical protein